MRLLPLVVGATGLLVLTAGAAMGDSPAPFFERSGSCTFDPTTGYGRAVVETITASRPNGFQTEVTATGGIVEYSADGAGSGGFAGAWVRVGNGDTAVIYDSESQQAGSLISAEVVCDPDKVTGFTVRYRDLPTVPATVSGRISEQTSFSGQNEHTVAFRLPANAEYELRVTLSSGAVSLNIGDGGRAQTLTSSQTIDLGLRQPGVVVVFVRKLDGPPASYTLGLTQRPLVLTALRAEPQVIRPSQQAIISYRLSGAGSVTASVKDGTGKVVRNLGDGFAQGPGAHTLRWDGLDLNGKPVADGAYAVSVSAVAGPGGQPTASQTTVQVDGTAPRIVIVQPQAPIVPLRGIVVRVSDAISGVRGGDIRIDGRRIARINTRLRRYIVVKPGGWTAGKHRVSVSAIDRVGNRSKASGAFTVR